MKAQERSKLGVVIVNYNSDKLLSLCLDRLLLQKEFIERVIIVDNASSDDSVNLVVKDEIIEIVQLQDNTGFAAANNYAFEKLQDVDLILTLNPDAFVQPGCFRALLLAAHDFPAIDCFAIRMMANDEKLDGVGDSYHFSGLIWRNRHGKEFSDRDLLSCEVFSPCAGAALYRKGALEEVGGFDDDFFCYAEDVDLGYRMKLAGMKCLYVPDAVVEHMGSAISNKYPGFALYHGHRNLVWVFVKNTPLPLLLLMLPAHIAMTLFLFFYFLFSGNAVVYLRAKKDAINGIRRMWGKRKTIHAGRRISFWQLLRAYNYSLFRI